MRRVLYSLASAALFITATIAVVVAPPPASTDAATAGYRALDAPQRLLDTRSGEVTADGVFAGVGAIGGGQTLELAIAGRAGIPNDPGSIVLNITATGSSRPGFIAAWPCDEEQPPTANLNYAPAQTIANSVIAKVDADGLICLFARSTVHVIVDAAGYLPGDSFEPLPAPERFADTRAGGDTVDGQYRGAGRRDAGSTYAVKIAGRGSIPGAATAAVLNVTVTGPLDRGFLTIYPCTAGRPLAANLTYAAGQTIPNAVLTRLDENGEICIFTRSATDLVVDATGVLPESVFNPLDAPQRIVDTRPTEATIDGQFQGGGYQPAFGTMQLRVAGRVGIPEDVAAVILNVTSTGSLERGFVTAHPQGSDRPTAANLNFPAGVNVSNLVVAAVGDTGDVCLFTRGTTHLVVDVVGWVSGPSVGSGDAPCPGQGGGSDAETIRNTYVRRPALHRAVGNDVVAVFICSVPTNSTRFTSTERHNVSSAEAAAYLNDTVSPYYAEISGGRYSVQFVGAGSFNLSANEDANDCRRGASQRAGAPYTGAFGIDNTNAGGGFAGPGLIYSDPSRDLSVLDLPASQSVRGGWLGGGNISSRPNSAAFIHELGHMLHWPHSFIGPGFEYDNWVDVMSRGQGWCPIPAGGGQYNCDPAHTLAFNRLAAGWLGDGDIVLHHGGTVNYLLDKPASSGVQMLLLPNAAQPLSMMTIEARPAIGHDDFFIREGVAVHLIDQLTRTNSPFSGFTTDRRQRQAIGTPNSYEHVVAVGQQVTAHGVTIHVLERRGDSFVVQVTGSYQMPAATFFAESIFSSSDIVDPVPETGDPDVMYR